MADDDYMTPAEFAELPAAQQHAVWRAADAGHVQAADPGFGQPRRYHRAQVRELLGETETAGA